MSQPNSEPKEVLLRGKRYELLLTFAQEVSARFRRVLSERDVEHGSLNESLALLDELAEQARKAELREYRVRCALRQEQTRQAELMATLIAELQTANADLAVLRQRLSTYESGEVQS